MRALLTHRLIASLAVTVTALLLVAGCGGDDNGGGPSTELEKALSYLPRDVAFALAVATDSQDGPLADLDRRLSGMEGWSELEAELEKQIGEGNDFERDVRPQLGNPAAFSASTFDEADPQEHSALVVQDPAAMRRLLEREVRSGAKTRLDDYEGALVVRDEREDADELRFEGLHEDVLIEGSSERQLRAAIDRSKGSDNLAANGEIADALGDAGREAVFSVAGDAARLLEGSGDADVAAARRVPWVRALRGFTVSGVVDDEGVRVEAEISTDEEGLEESEVPIATGADPARVHDPEAAIAVGLRDPGHFHRFLVGAARASGSRDLRQYVTAIDQLRSVGIDVYEQYFAPIENVSVGLESEDRGSFVAALRSRAAARFRQQVGQSVLIVQALAGELAGVEPDTLDIDSSGSGENVVWTVTRGDEKVLSYSIPGETLLGALGPADLPEADPGDPLPDTEGSLVVALSGSRLAELVREIDSRGRPDLRDATGRAVLKVLAGLERFRFAAHAETSGLTLTSQAVVPETP